MHGLFNPLLLFAHLGVHCSLDFADLGLRAGDQLALRCLNVLILLLLELEKLLLNTLAQAAEKLLPELLHKRLLWEALDDLLEHVPLLLVVLEEQVLLLSVELVLLLRPQLDLALAALHFQIPQSLLMSCFLRRCQLIEACCECLSSQVCHRLVLEVLVLHLDLILVDNAVEADPSVLIGKVLLQLEELLLQEERQLLLGCVVHGFVGNDEGLFFVARLSRETPRDLSNTHLQGVLDCLVKSVQLCFQLLVVDGCLLVAHLLLLPPFDLQGADLLLRLARLSSFLQKAILLQLLVLEVLLALAIKLLQLILESLALLGVLRTECLVFQCFTAGCDRGLGFLGKPLLLVLQVVLDL